jgi:hypothetical protein
MKRLILPFLCLIASITHAQTGNSSNFSLSWSHGQVFFKSGDTLSCNLRFNQNAGHHVLQVSEEGVVVTLPIKDVQSFSYFDSVKSRTRNFTAFKNQHHVAQEYYMERIYADPMFSILNHKTIEVPDELHFIRFIGKPVKTYKKYIQYQPTGKLVPLSRESLLLLLQPKREQILSFVKDHGLRFRRVSDFIRVLEYHSTL